MATRGRGVLKTRTKDQAKDTGMAMVLLLLLLAVILRVDVLVTAAIVVLVVAMAVPNLFRPLAVVWFGGAELLGTVISRVFLTVVFFVVITPVGLLRRVMGKDTLLLRRFHSDKESVMQVRDYTFSAADLERPY